jgi:large subunit ribosomal protein L28
LQFNDKVDKIQQIFLRHKTFEESKMARRCTISSKSRQHGHRVSHANNRRKHVFQPNIQSKRIWIPELNRSVRLKVSTQVLRTIDKIGLNATFKSYNISLKDLI